MSSPYTHSTPPPPPHPTAKIMSKRFLFYAHGRSPTCVSPGSPDSATSPRVSTNIFFFSTNIVWGKFFLVVAGFGTSLVCTVESTRFVLCCYSGLNGGWTRCLSLVNGGMETSVYGVGTSINRFNRSVNRKANRRWIKVMMFGWWLFCFVLISLPICALPSMGIVFDQPSEWLSHWHLRQRCSTIYLFENGELCARKLRFAEINQWWRYLYERKDIEDHRNKFEDSDEMRIRYKRHNKSKKKKLHIQKVFGDKH